VRRTHLSFHNIVFLNAPIADIDDAVGVARDILLVGDQKHGVPLLVQAFEEGHDLIAVAVSSAPVGSSASNSDGWFTRARAMATRWR